MLLVWASIWKWVKEKWQWVVGFLLGLITLLSVLARSRQQKKVLDVANESHKKENEINESAKEELASGLSEIAKEKNEEIIELIKESDEEKEKLKNEKDEFVEKNSGSDDLGKRIADHLGVEYVDSNKE